MKFRCNYCKKVIKRDTRTKAVRNFLVSKGYKSYCEKKKGFVILTAIK